MGRSLLATPDADVVLGPSGAVREFRRTETASPVARGNRCAARCAGRRWQRSLFDGPHFTSQRFLMNIPPGLVSRTRSFQESRAPSLLVEVRSPARCVKVLATISRAPIGLVDSGWSFAINQLINGRTPVACLLHSRSGAIACQYFGHLLPRRHSGLENALELEHRNITETAPALTATAACPI